MPTADYDAGCRVKSTSTKYPTRKSRTSSSPPISRPENALASRLLFRQFSKSLAKTCKSGSRKALLYLALESRLRRPGQMARTAGPAAYAWCALSSDDAGENRALASNAQEPHPARELLSARRSRSSDQCIRRVLQPPALSREHRQSHPSRRLLRARSSHPAGKRKDQTQDHPKPSVASPQTSRVTSTMMRQTLSWFTPPHVSKYLTTDMCERFEKAARGKHEHTL